MTPAVPGSTPTCLVLHAGALGDVLLAIPALAHLRQLGFRTTLGVASRLVGLFAGSGLVDVARDLEDLRLHRLFVDPPDPEALAAAACYDAVVSWLGAGDPTYRASLGRLRRAAVIARAAPPPGDRRHVSRHLLETLAPLGTVPMEMPHARLGVADPDRREAEAWLAARGIRRAEAVVLQPGAGSPAKAWPGFATLARRLREGGVPVVALAGPADVDVVAGLLESGGLDEDQLARDWPLARVAALLSLARAAVGNDSGPTHLAAAVGCATVAVFGPTDPAVWGPIGPRVRVVGGEARNSPWADASIDRVSAALQALLVAEDPPAPRVAGAALAAPWR